ncbi:MAG: 6,7-dimethyl-8-ribityllumazine synthase [Armatimonadota bacterium]|nr:6,7-dimethyl-8-ribityllumazine synthase [Armatimonadota bacterium]MDR7540468.1 6,7-dimethyl-8-ribityllumazine synthase [Armatimonadota bacterium]
MSEASGPRGATWEGSRDAAGLRFAIVVSRYNQGITEQLLQGAKEVLAARRAAVVDVAWVPGAFEIPLVARRLASSRAYDAVIALGCVIKGETAHFEHVSREAAAGVARAGYETGVPVIFQVLSVYDPAQAAARVAAERHRGREAAESAIAMATLLRRLDQAGR